MARRTPSKTKGHIGRSVYVSQFSMGQLDFERFDKILSAMDLWGARVWNDEEEAIRPFFALCKQFYKNIRHIVVKREKIDKVFEETKSKIDDMEMLQGRNATYKHLLPGIFDGLDEITNKIYEIKQWLGLGIEVQKKLSQKKKWERAMRISDD